MTKRERIAAKTNNRCGYCGDPLQKGWHLDHIEPVLRQKDGTMERPENNTESNLMAACPSCNRQKNRCTLEDFRHNIKQFVNSLNRYSTQYKFAKRYGLVHETGLEKVKFYFETL